MYNAMETLEVTASARESTSTDADNSVVHHDQQADVLSYWKEAQKQLPILRSVK